MTALEQMQAAFAKVRAFHKAVGATAPCNWDTYAATLCGVYRVDRPSLEAMRRIGHFHVDDHSVRFSR